MSGRSRRIVGALAALVVLAAAGFFTVNALTGDDASEGGTLQGSGDHAYTIVYPSSWRPLSRDEVKALPGSPLAVIRHDDGKGLVVLREEGRAPRRLTTLSPALTRALEKRFPDFERRTSKTVRVRAGPAFFYSYIRKSKGTVNAVAIVPAGTRSYAMNTVSTGGSESAARDIAEMILSFDVSD